jgi:hypothetical protein
MRHAWGMAMLGRVQHRHKFYSLRRFRMIGYMFADNGARPLESGLPAIARADARIGGSSSCRAGCAFRGAASAAHGAISRQVQICRRQAAYDFWRGA